MKRDETLRILHSLADGVNPVTGEPLGQQDSCQHPEVIRALFWAVQALEDLKGCSKAEKIGMAKEPRGDPAQDAQLTPEQEDCYRELKHWRNQRAKDDDVPPYVIAHNRHLVAMVVSAVCDQNDLLRIRGFGQGRVDKYGDEIICIVARSVVNGRKAIVQ